jgi:hypothetical protein
MSATATTTAPVIDNTELEALLERSFEDETVIDSLYDLLLQSTLFVLTPVGGERHGAHFLEAGTEIELVHFETDEDEDYVPVFTSLKQIQDTIDEEFGYMALPAAQVLFLTEGNNIVINPASEFGLFLSPDDIENLFDFDEDEEDADSAE